MNHIGFNALIDRLTILQQMPHSQDFVISIRNDRIALMVKARNVFKAPGKGQGLIYLPASSNAVRPETETVSMHTDAYIEIYRPGQTKGHEVLWYGADLIGVHEVPAIETPSLMQWAQFQMQDKSKLEGKTLGEKYARYWALDKTLPTIMGETMIALDGIMFRLYLAALWPEFNYI